MRFANGSDWYGRLEELRGFVMENNRLPKKREGSIGKWLTRQRVKYNGAKTLNKLTETQRNALEELYPGWHITRRSDDAWYSRYHELRQFIIENKRLPKKEEESIGKWLANQKSRYNGTILQELNEAQRYALDELYPGWHITFNPRTEDSWNLRLLELKQFITEHKRLPHNHENSIANWLSKQRSKISGKGKPLTTDQCERLTAVCDGWS